MKFRYLALLAIFIILFSLGTAVACENITDDALASDSAQDILNDESSVDDQDGVDLSVRLDVENVYQGKDYNLPGSEVPWTVTVTASGGVAENTKVKGIFTGNLEYHSHEANVGEYDSASGIWDIGDLEGSKIATLKIITKLGEGEKFTFNVTATTDSADADDTNNFDSLHIKSGYGKKTGNTTETTDDKNKIPHTEHQLSQGKTGFRQTDNNPSKTNSKSKDGKSKSKDDKSKSNDNKGKFNSPNGNEAAGSATKSTFSTVSGIFSSATDSIDEVINSTSTANNESTAENKSFKIHVDGSPVYDYTIIPILIFAAFLVILCAIVGYDRIKS